MLTPTPATWIVRGATFALWALAAGSAAFWGLKVASAARPLVAPAAAPRQVAPADPGAIARLLGSTPATAAAPQVIALSSRFQLLGVAAGANSGRGAAVISVDGKPARPYRVGSTIDEGYVLQSVRGRQAVIASQRDGQPVLTLELPSQRMDTVRPPAAGLPSQPLGPGPGAAAPAPAPTKTPGMPATPPTSQAASEENR